MNVWTDENSAVVTAELPGVVLEDIDISVEDDTLTLRGSRQPDEVENVTYHRRERWSGKFVIDETGQITGVIRANGEPDMTPGLY